MPRYASMVPLAALVYLGLGFVGAPPPPNNTTDTDAGSTSGKSSTARFRGSSAEWALRDTVLPAESETFDADGAILRPKGKHHPWYSLESLSEGLEWAASPGKYFKKMIAQHNGEPVFKIHPGLPMIAVTDHTSGRWFFEQPETVLDRQVKSRVLACLVIDCDVVSRPSLHDFRFLREPYSLFHPPTESRGLGHVL